MMKPALQAALKDAMGYSEETVGTCKDCQFSREEDDPNLERSWLSVYRVCGFNAIGPMVVSDEARCLKFQRREGGQ